MQQTVIYEMKNYQWQSSFWRLCIQNNKWREIAYKNNWWEW